MAGLTGNHYVDEEGHIEDHNLLDELATGALQKSSNLSDVPNKAEARAALELGELAQLDLEDLPESAGGSVSIPDGTYLKNANNLSDVPNKATARTALGVKSAGTKESTEFDAAGAATTAKTEAIAAAATAALQKSSNLNDVPNKATARNNLGLKSAAVEDVEAFEQFGNIQNALKALTNVVVLTQQEFDALNPPTAGTVYFIANQPAAGEDSAAVSTIRVGTVAAEVDPDLTPRIPEFDTKSVAALSASSVTTTFTHTVTAGITDPAVLVAVAHSGTGAASHDVTSVTYNGVAMTLLTVAVNDGTDGHPRFLRVYYRLNPPTGTSNVVVTMNSFTSMNGVAISSSYKYVNQTGPFGTPATAQANTGTTVSASVASAAATDRILSWGVARQVTTAPAPNSGQTFLADMNASTGSTWMTHSAKPGGGTLSNGYTWTGTNNNALVAASLIGASYSSGGIVTPDPVDPSDPFATNISSHFPARPFFDDFSTTVAEGNFINNAAYSSKFGAYGSNFYMTNQSAPSGDHYDGGSQMSVANSELILRGSTNGSGQTTWCAPTLKCGPGGSEYFTYGRLAFRFRVLDNTPGYKIAWMLWPQNSDNGTQNWPAGGEHDFIEGSMSGGIEANHHWYLATAGSQQDHWAAGKNFGTGYHTIVTEWTPSYVMVQLDGVEFGRRDASTSGGGTSRIVPNPMRTVLQCEVNLGGTQPALNSQCRIALDKVAFWPYVA
jgi:hypothetical protein